MKTAGKNQSLLARKLDPIKLKIDRKLCVEWQIFVAPIQQEMILGMDILNYVEAHVDFTRKKITLGDQELNLSNFVKTGNQVLTNRENGEKVDTVQVTEAVPLKLSHSIKLQGWSETVVTLPCAANFDSPYTVLEPTRDVPIMIARAVFHRDRVPVVSFINYFNKSIKLDKGTTVGYIYPLYDDSDQPAQEISDISEVEQVVLHRLTQ